MKVIKFEMMGEELGWISCVYPKMERLIGIEVAFIALGAVRGIYYLGIMVYMDYPFAAFAEITLRNIVLSTFMVYLYKKSKSVFPCTICHGMANLLPVYIAYDNSWYYTHLFPMFISMIPSLILGAIGL